VKKRDTLAGYLFITPSLIGIIAFFLIPFVFSLVLSFVEWNHLEGLSKIKFVGLGNYRKLLSDDIFKGSFTNNIIYAFVSVPISIILSLVLAIFLNDKVFGKKIFRAAFFMPYITNGIAVAFVWMLLYQPTIGPINMFLMSFGIKNPPEWLSSTSWSMPALIIIHIWATIGYNSTIYLANMQSISKDIYEAVELDGANGVQKFLHVTCPLLTPSTFFLLMTGIIQSFKVFDIISALTQGGPINSTMVLSYYSYTTAFRYYNMGYASAISWVLFLLVFVITIVQWKLQKHWVFY